MRVRYHTTAVSTFSACLPRAVILRTVLAKQWTADTVNFSKKFSKKTQFTDSEFSPYFSSSTSKAGRQETEVMREITPTVAGRQLSAGRDKHQAPIRFKSSSTSRPCGIEKPQA